ncbi:MAG: FAD-binding oxidoreductase [Betaproteobacteria bacterium]|nr:FAD-binding oxidoreductase [Betaproteobacteria bacterium]
MREADAIVVGGGLHGCSAALQLALRGRRVIVLERRHVGRHASGINAGGVRRLGRDLAEVPLSVQGMPYWHRIRELVGDDCGFTACGHVKVAESAQELETLEKRARTVRGLGFDHEEVIDAAEVRRLVPALAPHCVGAMVVRDDGAADPFRTTLAFGTRAREAGAAIEEGEAVVGIERQAGSWLVIGTRGRYRAPVVVNAAGAWAGRLAALVGDVFPMRTRASMMIVTERMPPFVLPVIGAVGRALSFKQSPSGTVIIGGGQQGRADLDQEQGWVDVTNLAKSAGAAAALFPRMRRARIVRSWCGIEAEMPDRLPVIDFSPGAPGFIHVFGFSGHGFQLGPICGVAVADLATRGTTDLPIASFAARRFAVAEAA